MGTFSSRGTVPPMPGKPATKPVFYHRRDDALIERVVAIKHAQEADAVRRAG